MDSDSILVTQNYRDFCRYAGIVNLIIIHFDPRTTTWSRIMKGIDDFLDKINYNYDQLLKFQIIRCVDIYWWNPL